MATGTGNLPNPGMSFSPFAILTAEEQNNLVENIESLATGTGIGDGAVTPTKTSFTSYSTSETLVGKWINGSNLYRKTIDTGALPNATTKSVAHGITGLALVIDMSGYAYNTTGPEFFDLPHVSTGATTENVRIDVQGSNIRIHTGINRTAFSASHITLLYTKT